MSRQAVHRRKFAWWRRMACRVGVVILGFADSGSNGQKRTRRGTPRSQGETGAMGSRDCIRSQAFVVNLNYMSSNPEPRQRVMPSAKQNSTVSTGDTSKAGLAACFLACLLPVMFVLNGCATKRPVLYPNEHYTLVGQQVAQREVAECLQLADQAGAANNKGGKVAGSTAGGAAVGGATGAAWGAVKGDAGENAAAGAGAAAGLVRGVMRSGDPGPIYKNFVQKCLRDRGYEVIGWK